MVLPLVLLVGSGVSAAVGAVTSAAGARKIRKAQGRVAAARDKYSAGEAETQASTQRLNARAVLYGDHQSKVAATTISEFITYLQTHGRLASADGVDALDGFAATPDQVRDFEGLLAEVGNVALGALTAVGTGVAARQGALALVGVLGTASTGAAIGGLSGVAATNATLAALGGGSLATGGGGMALGATVLGGVTMGPALLLAGFTLNSQGEKADTKATAYERDVEVVLARQQAFRELLVRVDTRIDELDGLLTDLDARARNCMAELPQEDLDPHQHAEVFQRALLSIKALAAVLRTPVIDPRPNPDGSPRLNTATSDLLATYRSPEPADA